RRLQAGQHVGADFNAYLGLGPTYLTYLAMKPVGSSFAASLYASHFLNALLYGLTIATLCRLCSRSWTLGIQGGAAAIGAALLTDKFGLTGLAVETRFAKWVWEFSYELVTPGNSSLGL